MSKRTKYFFAWQRLRNASTVFSNERLLSEQLEKAVGELSGLEAKRDLPKELVSDYESFMERMTNVQPTGEEGKIKATISRMSHEAMQKEVTIIWGLYEKFCGLTSHDFEE